jgi:hypothetical protein
MNTSTTITIKTEKKLRDAAKRTAKKLGIPLSTVINAQLAQFVTTAVSKCRSRPAPRKRASGNISVENTRRTQSGSSSQA